jgi:hypothetical protein
LTIKRFYQAYEFKIPEELKSEPKLSEWFSIIKKQSVIEENKTNIPSPELLAKWGLSDDAQEVSSRMPALINRTLADPRFLESFISELCNRPMDHVLKTVSRVNKLQKLNSNVFNLSVLRKLEEEGRKQLSLLLKIMGGAFLVTLIAFIFGIFYPNSPMKYIVGQLGLIAFCALGLMNLMYLLALFKIGRFIKKEKLI